MRGAAPTAHHPAPLTQWSLTISCERSPGGADAKQRAEEALEGAGAGGDHSPSLPALTFTAFVDLLGKAGAVVYGAPPLQCVGTHAVHAHTAP